MESSGPIKTGVRDLRERLMDFAVNVIKGLETLRHHPEGKHLVNQLFRSTTSVGANYEEAQAAESRADFVHKMQIALKELRETSFWLRLSERVGWFESEWRKQMVQESDELLRILSKAVITAKKPFRHHV